MKSEAKNLEFFIFFKKRLGKDFLLDSPWFVYSWTQQKCKKTHSNIILVSNLMWENSVLPMSNCKRWMLSHSSVWQLAFLFWTNMCAFGTSLLCNKRRANILRASNCQLYVKLFNELTPFQISNLGWRQSRIHTWWLAWWGQIYIEKYHRTRFIPTSFTRPLSGVLTV